MVLTVEEQRNIRKAIEEQTPEDFGIIGKLWTLGRTRQYIQKQFHKAINGLYEALGYELPASGEAHAETESYGHLKVEKEEYAPEYNPDEYLNHALKISVHSGQLPYTTDDISHKIQSFMRKLQQHPTIVSNFFLHSSLSYIYPQK